MLSDEEKKAIETIKDFKNLKWYEHAFDNGTEVLDEEQKQDIEIILNLIKKQSKEIEELKEKNEYLPNWVSKKYISKDKIKAKIEELDKEEKQQLKGTKGQDRYAIKQEYMHKRSGLQSLLEKE